MANRKRVSGGNVKMASGESRWGSLSIMGRHVTMSIVFGRMREGKRMGLLERGGGIRITGEMKRGGCRRVTTSA